MSVTSAQMGFWPDPSSYVAKTVDKMAGPAIPPAPASETRIRLRMVRGAGDRNAACRDYDDCLRDAARAGGEWHCPDGCASRSDLTREELLAEAIVGRCRSPLADMQEEAPVVAEARPRVAGRPPLAETVIAALANGSLTTLQIASVTGYARATLSSRMIDLERAELVRRVGVEKVHNKTTAVTVRWEVVK